MGKFEQPRTPKAAPSPKQAAPKKKKSPKKKGGKGLVTGLIIAGAAVAALVIGAVGYAVVLNSSGDILPDVYVAGVDVGGMSKEEAAAAVQAAVDGSYGSSTLTVKLPDRTLTFLPEDTNVSLDVAGAIEEAWNYGRDQGIIQTLKMRLTSGHAEHFINVEESLSIDQENIRAKIDEVAAEVRSERVDSTYELVQGEGPAAGEGGEAVQVPTQMVVHVGSCERSLDADGLYDAVIAAFMNNDFTPLEFGYDEVRYTPVDLDPLYAELCQDMKDAYYDAETKEIVDEVPGFGFDLAAAKQQQSMAADGETLTFTLQAIEPAVTRESLEEVLFADVLATLSSNHTRNSARTNNLDLACKAIDGTVLNAGDVFSFNGIVGERTAAKGYQAATVFVSGDSKPELGGGVCQVASTIYWCALKADLNIVERTEHMYTVDYVEMGMDATIYWDSKVDFKFSNSTSHPIRIDASVANGCVNITLVGTKEDDRTVDLTHKITGTTPWKDVEEVDETKPADYKQVTVTPYTGYRSTTYKRYLDASGNPLTEWETVQFPYSNYIKRDRVTVVGKQAEEEEPDPNGAGALDPNLPAVDPNPPAVDPNPPVTDPNPPVVDPNPPVTDPNPPVVDPNPPVTDPNPPVNPDPPVDPNPPVTDPNPPADPGNGSETLE